MTTLQIFQDRHAEALKLLNERIRVQLSSSNPLMSDLVSAQLRTKGKQLRPLLLMVCASLFGSLTDKVLAAAAAVELIHNASLIHDDVVDNAAMRRGSPTINSVWNNHIAVLVGDFFTSSAMREAISTGDIRIVDALCSLGRKLSVGEIDQIFNAREHSLSIDNYFAIIDYKTASLFVSSARMGCLAAGADAASTAALEAYAGAFGRCFQIRDDIFDYYPSAAVGKPTGNDLREGKVTLPLLYALDDDTPERPHMLELLEKGTPTDAEIDELTDFARRRHGIERSCRTMDELREKGLQALASLPDSAGKKELAGLLDFIIDRTY